MSLADYGRIDGAHNYSLMRTQLLIHGDPATSYPATTTNCQPTHNTTHLHDSNTSWLDPTIRCKNRCLRLCRRLCLRRCLGRHLTSIRVPLAQLSCSTRSSSLRKILLTQRVAAVVPLPPDEVATVVPLPPHEVAEIPELLERAACCLSPRTHLRWS